MSRAQKARTTIWCYWLEYKEPDLLNTTLHAKMRCLFLLHPHSLTLWTRRRGTTMIPWLLKKAVSCKLSSSFLSAQPSWTPFPLFLPDLMRESETRRRPCVQLESWSQYTPPRWRVVSFAPIIFVSTLHTRSTIESNNSLFVSPRRCPHFTSSSLSHTQTRACDNGICLCVVCFVPRYSISSLSCPVLRREDWLVRCDVWGVRCWVLSKAALLIPPG